MKHTSVQNWVLNRMERGKYIFTSEDYLGQDAHVKPSNFRTALKRSVSKGTVVSPWRNFYVAVPMEYRQRGIVPPSFYIDNLMKYLDRDYYVALLSAAELNGAAHQRPMVFQVIVSGPPIRSGIKSGTKLEFTLRQNLPLDFVTKVKTQMGYMNVSGPELTSLDLIAEEKKIGGLSRATEILVELAEKTTWDDSKLPLLGFFSMATIQRLGYLLELIEENHLADRLYGLVKRCGRTMRRTPLKQHASCTANMQDDNRWKIIKNYKIEIDEI